MVRHWAALSSVTLGQPGSWIYQISSANEDKDRYRKHFQ